jgi:hypothetical protein
MKNRFWLSVAIILSVILTAGFWAMGVHAAEDQYVCGKTFTYFYEETTYLAKFINANPELPCTAGTITLSWQDKKASYDFRVDSNGFITLSDGTLLTMMADKLFFLDTCTIVFDEF